MFNRLFEITEAYGKLYAKALKDIQIWGKMTIEDPFVDGRLDVVSSPPGVTEIKKDTMFEKDEKADVWTDFNGLCIEGIESFERRNLK